LKQLKNKVMEVFITTYALSNKIIKMKGSVKKDLTTFEPHITEVAPRNFYHKPNWHLTRQSALDRAEEMRINNIKNLTTKLKTCTTDSEVEECKKRVAELKNKIFFCDSSNWFNDTISEEDALREYEQYNFIGIPSSPMTPSAAKNRKVKVK
jgi:hypothetical protein